MTASDALSDEFFNARKAELALRVAPKRLKHIEGVALTASLLAERYHLDVKAARLAGLLHDWDKGYDDEGIRARVLELGLDNDLDPWVVQYMPQILHGPTAAVALRRDFPEIPDIVIDAIGKHTTASLEMTDLDKVIYIADAIEPSRKFDAIDSLREGIDELTLDELYLRIYKFWIISLIEHDTVLYPGTIEIWNNLASRARSGELKSDRCAARPRRRLGGKSPLRGERFGCET